MNELSNKVDAETYRHTVRRVLLVTLTLNIAVVIGKLIAGFMAGALSVISDAIHSSVDSLNNIVGLIVMKYATAEPDEGHPYGHGKFETLAAFVIAGILFITCYEISHNAIKRIFFHDTHVPEITYFTIGVMVITIIANIIVTVYERREGKRINSAFLIADSAHTRSDVLVSCSVLAGLILIKLGYVKFDPVISLGVGVVIAWSGYEIFKSTIPVLVDAAPVPSNFIADIVQNVSGVHSVHDIRSRSQSGTMFIEMHMHIKPEFEQDHIASHNITEEVEKRLEREFGKVTATIHVEPL